MLRGDFNSDLSIAFVEYCKLNPVLILKAEPKTNVNYVYSFSVLTEEVYMSPRYS